ncbi:hypothetical protein [Dysosmobacter sp.]|jgi:hypothetical protein|uniref:hypothetical protein n=1 Tax=Dysosmobacter sp. TaxID=2591382 RepID=UPI003D8E3CA9
MNMEAKKLLPVFGIVVLVVIAVLLMGYIVNEDDTYLNPTATHELLSKYRREIDLVEATCQHPIEEISSTTRKEIASVANRYLYNSDYQFSELMTDIAYAFALQEE